jgi:hypothetical protein
MAPDPNNDLITDRCPSIVRECPGKQFPDTFSDVAWMSIKDKNTLGVTWYYSNLAEADVALNTRFTWILNSDIPGTFDPLTVFIHENGHVLGLSHSKVEGSIMEAVYDGVRKELHPDDICGIQSIYGTQEDACGTTISSPEPTTGDATTADIDYKIRKGPNGGLLVTATLLDGTQPVSGTSVKIELFRNGNYLGTATGDTNNEGKAGFILYNPVKSGTYKTTVLEVAGAAWGGATKDPGFTK